MNRTGRGVIGNKPASGTEIIQELGEEHQRTGKWIVYTSADSVFQIAAHEETVPLEELYDACRVAREILTGKHAVGRVIARPFVGEPGAYERTPNRHDFSLEPRAAELPLARPRRGHKVYGVGKIGDIFARPGHRRVVPDEVERRRDPADRGAAARPSTTGWSSRTSSRPTSLWGHRNDPVNFHRCLQDFDRRLPDLLDALRPGDLLILTSDHGCDPTTPSTDHSREHALLLAYVEGRNAAGRIHEGGEFADVGATVNAWLGGKARVARSPGYADRRRHAVERASARSRARRAEYADERACAARAAAYTGATAASTREPAGRGRRRSTRRARVLEVGLRLGRARRVGRRAEHGSRDRRRRPLAAHGRAGARARCRRRASPTSRRFRPRTASSTSRRRLDALPRA